MADIQIKSIVKFKTDVYIKGDDLINALYRDMGLTTNPILREYLQESIDGWEQYIKDAIESKR